VTPPTIAPFNASSSPIVNSFVPSDAPSYIPSVVPSSGIAGLYGTNTRESVCDDIFSEYPVPSNATTDVYNIVLAVLLNDTNVSSISELVLEVLNEEIAPALVGCETRNSRKLIANPFTRLRQMLESNSTNETNILGIKFHSPTTSENGKLKQ
jgi:hypothetical protein